MISLDFIEMEINAIKKSRLIQAKMIVFPEHLRYLSLGLVCFVFGPARLLRPAVFFFYFHLKI